MAESTVDLSALARRSLDELSEICLFARAGLSAIGLAVGGSQFPKLCVELAKQGLAAARCVPALETCMPVLTDIADGKTPTGDLQDIVNTMEKVCDALVKEHDRRKIQYYRLRGISDP